MSVKSESYNDAYSAEQKKSLDKAIAERAERIDGIVAGYLPRWRDFRELFARLWHILWRLAASA